MKQRYWFTEKWNGWCWVPSSWEGWVILVLYYATITGILIVTLSLPHTTKKFLFNVVPAVLTLTLILIAICFRTGKSTQKKDK